jgi:queuine tRNA-ribosyltransferase
LYKSRELLAYRLNTIHNLHYYLDLMANMREAIQADGFDAFKGQFYENRAQGV